MQYNFSKHELLGGVVFGAAVLYFIGIVFYNHTNPSQIETFEIVSKSYVEKRTEYRRVNRRRSRHASDLGLVSTLILAHYRVNVHWGEGLRMLIVPTEKEYLLKGKEITLRYRMLKNGKFRVLEYLDEAVRVDSVEFNEFGIFSNQDDRSNELAEGADEAVLNSEETRLISQTDRIPAAIGVVFGYKFSVKGSPKGAMRELVLEITHPDLFDPVSRQRTNEDRFHYPAEIGDNNFIVYVFEKDWELVPGDWIFRVKSGDSVLAEKTFTVFKP